MKLENGFRTSACMRIDELTGPKFEELGPRLAFLPVGSVERHGDHLPLGTDTIIAEHLARELASRTNGILLPTIPYGPCIALRDYPGTFDVDWEALYRYVLSVLREAARNGLRKVVIVNGHGGNTNVLKFAARKASIEHDMQIVIFDWWRDVAQEVRKELFPRPGHAGEDETSVLLAIRPDLADMERADANEVPHPTLSLYSPSTYREVFVKPLIGDARRADPERGRRLLDAVIEEVLDFLREWKMI